VNALLTGWLAGRPLALMDTHHRSSRGCLPARGLPQHPPEAGVHLSRLLLVQHFFELLTQRFGVIPAGQGRRGQAGARQEGAGNEAPATDRPLLHCFWVPSSYPAAACVPFALPGLLRSTRGKAAGGLT
jgi:hypothetical protein